MMLVRCYLAPSRIEGLGVFAGEPIRKGQEVWRFDARFDRLIPKADLADLPPHAREFFERYGYDMPDAPDCLALDADESRFMNHAGQPNVAFSAPQAGYAVRDIAEGEELTSDYAQFTLGELVFQPARHRLGRHGANGAAA